MSNYANGTPNLTGLAGPAIGPGGGTGYVNGPIQILVASSAPSIITYSPVPSDYVMEVNATAAAFTIALPPATSCGGREYIIKKVDSSTNTVTVSDASGPTVDGAASVILTAQYAVISLISDGTNWVITGGSVNGAPNGSAGAIAAITVTASPFTYTAPSNGTVVASGGTVTAYNIKRGATSVAIGEVAGAIPVKAGDQVLVTYSAAPTMDFIPG